MATPIPANRARFTTWSAAAATGGTIARMRGEGAHAIGITSDSRAVVPGCAFVALRGGAHDGHDYLSDAAARGAVLLVVARGHGRALPEADVVEVDDTRKAWGALAAAHLRAWRRSRRSEGYASRVVAITGSAGKTTTKELCASLVSVVAPSLATAGNLNNDVGLPAMVFCLTQEHRFAVFEMGMNAPGEIAALAEIAPPDVAVIVNAGLAHAEGVGGTREAVAREKGAIYAALSREGIAIVNADDSVAAAQVARSHASREITFGRGEGARYRLVERTPRGARGSGIVVSRDGELLTLELPLVGEAAAIDFVAALAAADAACERALPHGAIARALANASGAEGRAKVRMLNDGTLLLDDTYNANPASMRAAIATLAEIARSHGDARRTVVVLGEMKELGVRAREEHDAIGALLAEQGVALAIGCGGLIDVTLDRAANAGVSTLKTASAREAADAACAHVRARDAVLVKGSRSVRTEIVTEALARARGEANPDGEVAR